MLIWGSEINDGNTEQLPFSNSPIFHMQESEPAVATMDTRTESIKEKLEEMDGGRD